ncbi:MAG: DUF3488 domain-containing transglutaminase family protein [Desulfobacterales bacterium]|nr:DUF3488 domain-containing transglutaminase family protein [Desulfobacterales bacterium]
MDTFDRHIPPILGALLVSIAPFILKLPPWIVLWCFVLWGYVFLSVKKTWPPPSKYIRMALTLCGMTGAFLNTGLMIGGDAFIGLLSVMAGLKPLEIRSHRDKMITIFMAYFIVIAGLFYSESLAITIYMFLSVFVTTAVLIHINSPGQIKANMRLSGHIMVQAIPLMVILFFLFPRLHGTMWGINRTTSGRSGFSDSMSPGNISKLVQSDEVAFRVSFKGKAPKRDILYWRGIVFEFFDGKEWSTARKRPINPGLLKGENTVEYTITLEPHDDRWLFALDMPASMPDMATMIMLHDYTMYLKRDLTKKYRYKVKSYTSYNTGAQQGWTLRVLKLPHGVSPKARELALKWADENNSPEKIIDTALAFIRENDFSYTLEPPLLENDFVDDFLFVKRKGYCEHYASAFAFLMRAANIPARVVGGYLGGEANPYGDYLIVRQSDAHVWVEVWIQGKGWLRVDPVSAVAPERIESGESVGSRGASGLFSLKRFENLESLWKNIRFGWDAVNNQWDIWFSGYSSEQQEAFLSRIGINTASWKGLAKALLLAVGLTGLLTSVFIFRILRKTDKKKDPVLLVYNRFCRKLAKTGLPRKSEQGPADYAAMIGARRKDLEEKVGEITGVYVLLRYGRNGDENSFKKFKYLVKKFAP